MEEITSLQNPRIKYIVKLRDDRRQRQRDRLTIVEGRYELEVALTSELIPKEIYCCEALARQASIISGFPITTVSRPVFEKMSQRENPDGWLAVFPIPSRSIEEMRVTSTPFLVMVESVEKPGNLGAIFRTVDAVGVDGVLVCEPRVDLFNPNVVRASRGTLFTTYAVEVSNEDAFTWLKARGIRIIASTPGAKTAYTSVDQTGPVCIAMGSEDEGLSDFWLGNSDYKVKIPMMGKVNSLNVSTSAAILLYEVMRQRNL